VRFTGEYPCHHTGVPIEAIRNTSNLQPLWEEHHVQHRFSNKPQGLSNYPNYCSKMKAYIEIISNEARAIDPAETPWTLLAPVVHNGPGHQGSGVDGLGVAAGELAACRT